MFKEAFIGIFILFLLYLLCRFLWKKSRKGLSLLIVSVLFFSCAANIIYNAKNTFPDFYMDTVTGAYRYGTFSENLFAYSDEFMFQDNILFPVLKNRNVSLDSSAGFYQKFFSLYAEDCTMFDTPETSRNIIREHLSDFDFSHEFTCIGIMDYAKEEIPEDLAPSFEEESYPQVYIHTKSLQDQQQLVCIMDSDYSLYVMSKDYYTTLTGESDHE